MSTHVLSTLREHTSGFLVKIFGECYESTVLTAACYWPSSHCIPTKKFVSVSVELNHNRSPWALDINKQCRISPSLGSPQNAYKVPPNGDL